MSEAHSKESQELRNERAWKDPENWSFFQCIYSAKDDTRILVPKKQIYLGWTFNFAHFESYALLGALAGSVAIASFVKKASR